ncbi:MAG: Na/Pi symporter [Alphaproteobacteria bacterium]
MPARGLIAGVAGLAIMLGTDVGTTVVAQVLSFDLRWLSPLALAVGVFTFLASEKSRRRSLARSAIGLGLILLSLQTIVAASAPLRESETFPLLLQPLAGEAVLAVIVAALITGAAHSSLAMVLLIMSLTAGGVLGPDVALAMVLGANLGGAMIAVGATWRAPPAGSLWTI